MSFIAFTIYHISTAMGRWRQDAQIVRTCGLCCAQVDVSPGKSSAVTALGTLQNLAAESAANKDAIREAGGIPVLLHLLETAPDTPVRLPTPHDQMRQMSPCNTFIAFSSVANSRSQCLSCEWIC